MRSRIWTLCTTVILEVIWRLSSDGVKTPALDHVDLKARVFLSAIFVLTVCPESMVQAQSELHAWDHYIPRYCQLTMISSRRSHRRSHCAPEHYKKVSSMSIFEVEQDQSENRKRDAFKSVGWLRPRTSTLQQHPLDIAQSYLAEHSKRTLSYDADALDAIVGALNTLIEEDVYHIWGVPFRLRGIERSSYFKKDNSHILASWAHSSIARRRPGFPSWNPLCWTGTINFNRAAMIGIDLSNVEMSVDGQFLRPITECAREGILSPTDVSQKIRIQCVSYTPSFAVAAGIAIPFADSAYYLARVAWSVIPSPNHDGVMRVKVLLLRDCRGCEDWILVLKRSGKEAGEDIWERIGFASLSVLSNDRLQRMHSTQWLDLKFRPVSTKSVVADRLEATLASSYSRGQKRWIRHCFLEDTVVII